MIPSNGRLINATRTRRFILDNVECMRPDWKCSRVSQEALDMIEAKCRSYVKYLIEVHRSVGQTFRP